MSERKDAALDVVEGVAAAGLEHLGVALAPIAEELLPIGAKQFVAVAIATYHRRKANAFWTAAMTHGETVSEFVDWVNARLAEDPDRVTTSFAEGARAAAEKADLAAVPSIALLTRRYAAGAFPKWFFRGALDVLVMLSAFEFGQLQAIVHQLADRPSDDGHLQLSNAKGPATISSRVGGVESQAPLDFKGHHGNQLSRYMRLLKQTGLAHESGGYGIGGSHNAMVIETDTVRMLAEIMPRE